MSELKTQTKYDKMDETREYRTVTIERNRKIKSGEEGCYYVKDKLCTSIQDAQDYIDAMIEACGIEFFKSRRKNPLLDGINEFGYTE
jgi:hypothetical protein